MISYTDYVLSSEPNHFYKLNDIGLKKDTDTSTVPKKLYLDWTKNRYDVFTHTEDSNPTLVSADFEDATPIGAIETPSSPGRSGYDYSGILGNNIVSFPIPTSVPIEFLNNTRTEFFFKITGSPVPSSCKSRRYLCTMFQNWTIFFLDFKKMGPTCCRR